MTPNHKRHVAICTFIGSASLLICFPISVLGYVPELVIGVCIITFAVSVVFGVLSMPTKLGMVAWAVIELCLVALIGFVFWWMSYQ
jgi:hypothetical protein